MSVVLQAAINLKCISKEAGASLLPAAWKVEGFITVDIGLPHLVNALLSALKDYCVRVNIIIANVFLKTWFKKNLLKEVFFIKLGN